jgi:uncharacterized membrane protein (DUF106 family)
MLKMLKPLIIIAIAGIAINYFWNNLSIVKDSIGFILNPTIGALLDWNVSIGMIVVAGGITLITTLLQKFMIDADELRELKKEQKELQEEMKKFKDNPEKTKELIAKQFTEITPKLMEKTMKPVIYTIIPIILTFRWFGDYFTLNEIKVFGFAHWLLAYIVIAVIFSLIFRKLFKLP